MALNLVFWEWKLAHMVDQRLDNIILKPKLCQAEVLNLLVGGEDVTNFLNAGSTETLV